MSSVPDGRAANQASAVVTFTPPITALGAGHDVVYLGISGPRVENGRIVALSGSGITSPADLRGKRVAVAKGSSANGHILLQLKKAGLSPADVAARSRAEVLSRVAEARSENGEKPAAVPPGVTKGWRIGDKRNSLRDKEKEGG